MIKFWHSLVDEWRPRRLNCFGDGGDGSGSGSGSDSAAAAAAASDAGATAGGWDSGSASQAASDATAGVSAVGGTGFAGFDAGNAWAGAPSGTDAISGSISGDLGGTMAAPGGWSAGDAWAAAGQAMAGESAVGGIGGYSGWGGWGGNPEGPGVSGGGPGGWDGTGFAGGPFSGGFDNSWGGTLGGDPFGTSWANPGTSWGTGFDFASSPFATPSDPFSFSTFLSGGYDPAIGQIGYNTVPGLVESAINTATQTVGNFLGNTISPVTDPVMNAIDSLLSGPVTDVGRGITDAVTQAISTVTAPVSQAISNAQTALGTQAADPTGGLGPVGWTGTAGQTVADAYAQQAAQAQAAQDAYSSQWGGGPGQGQVGGVPGAPGTQGGPGGPDFGNAFSSFQAGEPTTGPTTETGGMLSGVDTSPTTLAETSVMATPETQTQTEAPMTETTQPQTQPQTQPTLMVSTLNDKGEVQVELMSPQEFAHAYPHSTVVDIAQLAPTPQTQPQQPDVPLPQARPSTEPQPTPLPSARPSEAPQPAPTPLPSARPAEAPQPTQAQVGTPGTPSVPSAPVAPSDVANQQAQQAQQQQATQPVPFAPTAPSLPGQMPTAQPLPFAPSAPAIPYAPVTAIPGLPLAPAPVPAPIPAPVPGTPGRGARSFQMSDRNNKSFRASQRYNNPGAQWPSQESARFGQTDVGRIGASKGAPRGNLIAGFPTPVHGLASNIALAMRSYQGMTIGKAISKWSDGIRSSVPGYDSKAPLTKDILLSRDFWQKMEQAESGKGSQLSPEQIDKAIDMVKAGSSQAWESANPNDPTTIAARDFRGAASAAAFAPGAPVPSEPRAPAPSRGAARGHGRAGARGHGRGARGAAHGRADIPTGTQFAANETPTAPGPQSGGLAGTIGGLLGGALGISSAQATEGRGAPGVTAGRADTSLQGRQADSIVSEASKGLGPNSGLQDFSNSMIQAARGMAKAGIPTTVARQALDRAIDKGLAARGVSRSDYGGMVGSTINGVMNTAMTAYSPAPPGPVQGPALENAQVAQQFAAPEPTVPTELSPNQMVAQDFAQLGQPGMPTWAQSVNLAPSPAPELSPNQVVAQEFNALANQPSWSETVTLGGQPQAPAPTQDALQEAGRDAQADPQTAQQIASAYPEAVANLAAAYFIDEATAAMMLLRMHPPDFPPAPAPKAARGGRVQKYRAEPNLDPRQTWYPQYPHFNDEAWTQAVESWPESENIEDRRFNDPTMPSPTPAVSYVNPAYVPQLPGQSQTRWQPGQPVQWPEPGQAKGGRVKFDEEGTYIPFNYPNFNEEAWQQHVEAMPLSENIEDRRVFDPTWQPEETLWGTTGRFQVPPAGQWPETPTGYDE